MKRLENSRREFLSNAGMIAGAALTGGSAGDWEEANCFGRDL